MEEEVSKSQKKREADALQKVATQFVELSLARLGKLPLPENLYKAIVDAKSIKSHGAKRRQFQLIGKLMRGADYEAILSAYQKMMDDDEAVTADFHEVELWRDKLIHQGKEALTEFIDLHPTDEVQQLRNFIKKAIEDEQKQRNTGAAKALFRFLRSIIK